MGVGAQAAGSFLVVSVVQTLPLYLFLAFDIISVSIKLYGYLSVCIFWSSLLFALCFIFYDWSSFFLGSSWLFLLCLTATTARPVMSKFVFPHPLSSLSTTRLEFNRKTDRLRYE